MTGLSEDGKVDRKTDRAVQSSLTDILLAAPSPCSHLLQIYEDDEQLLDRLEDFIYFGLERLEACVVVATPSHRTELKRRLASIGVDVEQAIHQKLYLELDARETLGMFMREGSPDLEKFQTAVRDCLVSVRSDGRSVRAFGEMVALLWNDGNRQAAVELEDLWNDIIRAEKIALFCAYPSEMHENEPSELVNRVYATHTALVL